MMSLDHSAFAIHLTSPTPGAWRWSILDEEGAEAASGTAAQQADAMRLATLFQGSLSRFRSVTRAW